MNTEVKKPMTRSKIVWISIAAVAAVLAIVVIILACVRVSPQPIKGGLKAENISSVQIISNGAYNWNGDGTSDHVDLDINDATANSALDRFVKTYNKATDYSVGYGILNNVWSNKVKVITSELNIAAIKSIAGNTQYPLVVVRFNAPRTETVAKESVKFDCLFFKIHDTSNSLQKFAFYLIDSSKLGSDAVEDLNEDYEVKEYHGYMNGSKITNLVKELKDKK